jgi:hypothetical protein
MAGLERIKPGHDGAGWEAATQPKVKRFGRHLTAIPVNVEELPSTLHLPGRSRLSRE